MMTALYIALCIFGALVLLVVAVVAVLALGVLCENHTTDRRP